MKALLLFATCPALAFGQSATDTSSGRLDSMQVLQSVSVRSQRALVQSPAPGRTVLQVAGTPLGAGASVLDLLGQVPGVDVDRQNNQVRIQGRSGVQLQVNGVPVLVPAPDVFAWLQNYPADGVQRLEVNSQPSARYDASASGIINLVLKGTRRPGVGGSVTAGAGQGRTDKENASVSLNGQHGAWSWQLNADAAHNPNHLDVRANRQIVRGDSVYPLYQWMRFRQDRWNYNGALTAAYQPSRRWNAYTQVQWSRNTNRQFNPNPALFGSADKPDSLLLFHNRWRFATGRTLATAGGAWHFDTAGRQLSVELTRLVHRVNDGGQMEGSTEYPNKPPHYQQIGVQYPVRIDITAARADLSWPLRYGHSLEGGIKQTSVRIASDALLEERSNGSVYRDPAKNQSFRYREQVRAAYASWQWLMRGHTLRAGLRAERTELRTNAPGATPYRIYTDLFPTLSYERKTGAWRYNASYARRIERPNYANLNPNSYLQTPVLFYQGNPALSPEYLHTAEAGLGWKEYGLSIGFTATTGRTEWVAANDSNGVMRATYINGDRYRNWYLVLQAPLRIRSWWQVQNTVQLNADHAAFRYAGSSFRNEQLFYVLKTTHRLRIAAQWSADVFAQYQSAYNLGLIRYEAQGTVNIGVQRRFGAAHTLTANVSDLFYTNNLRLSANLGNLRMQNRVYGESRVLRVSYSYRFGSTKNTQVKIRSAEETGRL